MHKIIVVNIPFHSFKWISKNKIIVELDIDLPEKARFVEFGAKVKGNYYNSEYIVYENSVCFLKTNSGKIEYIVNYSIYNKIPTNIRKHYDILLFNKVILNTAINEFTPSENYTFEEYLDREGLYKKIKSKWE